MSDDVLRVVSGSPTAEELAALVAVLSTRSAEPAADEPPRQSSAWSAPSWQMRPAIRPGPDAWRRSAFRS